MEDKKQGVITAGVAGSYTVVTREGQYTCPARGLFRLQGITPLVGDRVIIALMDDAKKTAVVYEILDRKNELIRPKVANIDLGLITFSIDNPSINWQLLDEMILQSEKAGIKTGIVINKMDLQSGSDADILKSVYEPLGYPVFLVSATEATGVQELKTYVTGKISLFLGPSGVGKSSLINNLSEGLRLETGEISKKTKRGKHTTRQTKLLKIARDTFVLDSPGFSALETNVTPQVLWQYYPDFVPHAKNCQFNDCIHYKEKKCAVKDALGKTVDKGRYDRYISILEKLLDRKETW